MTKPTILDLMLNATMSDREFRKVLFCKAEELSKDCFEEKLNERAARLTIAEKLVRWMSASGFTGRQTKKMVEKAAKRVLQNYSDKLRSYYIGKLAELELAGQEKSLDGWIARSEAESLRFDLRDGRIGNERFLPWRSK